MRLGRTARIKHAPSAALPIPNKGVIMVNQHESLHYVTAATEIVADWLERDGEDAVTLARLFPSYDGEAGEQNASAGTRSRVCLAARVRRMRADVLLKAVYGVVRLCNGLDDVFGDIESDPRLCGSIGTHNPAHGRHVG